MKRTLLTIALVVVCSTLAQAQKTSNASALRVKVRELIALMGSGDIATQMIDQMMPAMKQMAPDVPDAVWDELQTELNVDELIEQMVPVYIEEYTEKEIDAMLKFYRTPEGRSVVAKMPAVMAKTMQVGQEWGQNAAMRVFTRLKEKGYTPKS